MTDQNETVVLDVRWFNTGRGSVGIVCVEMPDDQEPPQRAIRYFIAPVAGHHEPSDKATVADWGARFPDEVGALLFGRVDTMPIRLAPLVITDRCLLG